MSSAACRESEHVLGDVIRDGNKAYTRCSVCQEKVELVQKTLLGMDALAQKTLRNDSSGGRYGINPLVVIENK